jgi:hypothetical protein
MSNNGWMKMSVCEMLHCTYTELNERLKNGSGYIDYELAVSYILRKNELENMAIKSASNKK